MARNRRSLPEETVEKEIVPDVDSPREDDVEHPKVEPEEVHHEEVRSEDPNPLEDPNPVEDPNAPKSAEPELGEVDAHHVDPMSPLPKEKEEEDEDEEEEEDQDEDDDEDLGLEEEEDEGEEDEEETPEEPEVPTTLVEDIQANDIDKVIAKLELGEPTTKTRTLVSILIDMHNTKVKLSNRDYNKQARDIYNDWYVLTDVLRDYQEENDDDSLTKAVAAIKKYFEELKDVSTSYEDLVGLTYLLKDFNNYNQLKLTKYNIEDTIKVIELTFAKLTGTELPEELNDVEKQTTLLNKLTKDEHLIEVITNKL